MQLEPGFAETRFLSNVRSAGLVRKYGFEQRIQRLGELVCPRIALRPANAPRGPLERLEIVHGLSKVAKLREARNILPQSCARNRLCSSLIGAAQSSDSSAAARCRGCDAQRRRVSHGTTPRSGRSEPRRLCTGTLRRSDAPTGRVAAHTLSPILSRTLDAFAGCIYFPPGAVYECAGLSPAPEWRARAPRNRHADIKRARCCVRRWSFCGAQAGAFRAATWPAERRIAWDGRRPSCLALCPGRRFGGARRKKKPRVGRGSRRVRIRIRTCMPTARRATTL
jgi:hypothetical protein